MERLGEALGRLEKAAVMRGASMEGSNALYKRCQEGPWLLSDFPLPGSCSLYQITMVLPVPQLSC